MPPQLITRPKFPEGYLLDPKSFLTWEQVDARLAEAKNYWLCSVRPNHKPHSIPVWGAWVNEKFYFDGSPQTRHALNIAQNPYVSLHLESGDQVVVMDGIARDVLPDPGLAVRIARSYADKYAAAGYSPEPTSWDAGGLFEVTPHKVIAWTSFMDDPTKFVFA